jgi:hypothetical protein
MTSLAIPSNRILLPRRGPSAAIPRSRPGSFAWPGLVGDAAKRRRGPERRDIVFWKGKVVEKM